MAKPYNSQFTKRTEILLTDIERDSFYAIQQERNCQVGALLSELILSVSEDDVIKQDKGKANIDTFISQEAYDHYKKLESKHKKLASKSRLTKLALEKLVLQKIKINEPL